MAIQLPNGPPVRSRRSARVAGWLIPVGFSMLACYFLLRPSTLAIPETRTPSFDRSSLRAGPRRVAMTDPPQAMVEGQAENCNACHQIFQGQRARGPQLNFHREIRLRHGMNNRCVNCHAEQDRERLSLRDGTTVAFAETPRLCAQCHGTVFRDWERGTHGKNLGSWSSGNSLQRRLTCNECHDPHGPRYDAVTPLPGPNTLRMGPQNPAREAPSSHQRNPLRRGSATAPARSGRTLAPEVVDD